MKALMVAAALVACDSSTAPDVRFNLEAELEGSGQHAELAATVEVAARPTTFTAEVDVTGGTASGAYAWHIARGTCAAPGERVGAAAAYANIQLNAQGAGSRTAQVTAVLHADTTYHVALREPTGEQPATIACGVLAAPAD